MTSKEATKVGGILEAQLVANLVDGHTGKGQHPASFLHQPLMHQLLTGHPNDTTAHATEPRLGHVKGRSDSVQCALKCASISRLKR